MALKVEDGLGKEGMQVVQGHVTRALYEMIHTCNARAHALF